MARIEFNGGLALAAKRWQHPIAVRDFIRRQSTWALICEEVLDTEHNPDHYDQCMSELIQRGVTAEQLLEMRLFAWKTVGWWNFEKALWEEIRLDEGEILLALEWMEREGEIDPFQRLQAVGYIQDWRGIRPPVLPP